METLKDSDQNIQGLDNSIMLATILLNLLPANQSLDANIISLPKNQKKKFYS
jgi:hypothetical protein